MCIYPTPLHEQDVAHCIFKWSLTSLNSEFFFSSTSCHAKFKEFSLSYFLLIDGEKTAELIPFPRVLVLYEKQTVLFKI